MVKPGEQLTKGEECVKKRLKQRGRESEKAPKFSLIQNQTENKKISSPRRLFLSPSLSCVRSLAL